MQRGANTSVLWISAAGGLLAICSLPLRWHQEILGPAGPVLDVRGWNVQPFASLLVAALLTTAVVVYRRVRSGGELQRPLLAALLAPLLTLLWMLLSDAVPDAQDRFSRPIGGGYFFLAASAVAQAASLWLLLRQAEPRAESARRATRVVGVISGDGWVLTPSPCAHRHRSRHEHRGTARAGLRP